MAISLRFKMIFLTAVLLVLTTGGVVWICSQPFVEEHHNMVLEINTQASAGTVSQIQDHFELVIHRLAALGREVFIRKTLDPGSNFLMVSLLSPESPSAFRSEKTLYAASVSTADVLWWKQSSSYLSQASRGGPQFFPVTLTGGQTGVGVAIPYMEENHEMRGRVLAGIISTAQILDRLGESDQGSRLLVNAAGILLVKSGGSHLALGSNLSAHESVAAFLNRKMNNGQYRGVSIDGQSPTLNGFQTIGNLGLGLITEVPESTAFGPMKRVQYRTVLFAMIIFCIAFFVGTFYSETITAPLSELVAATEIVKKGHFDIEITTNRRDEIGQLSKAFVVMASELKVQQEALINQEKLVVAGRLARNIGHEFGNVLQPLLTKLEILQSELSDLGQEDHVQKIQEMIEITTLGAGICKGLMTLSKETAETTTKAPFYLAEAVRKAIHLLSHELKKKDIQVEIKVPDHTKLFGSESQLIQVLINMAVNSSHAMNDGGKIGFIATESDARVRLEVQDNGSGIALENLEKIFEPLFSTKGTRGNGLGLSISKAIIESHGGTVQVESKVGEGTRMILDFPLIETMEKAA